jgi:hypothetical protein
MDKVCMNHGYIVIVLKDNVCRLTASLAWYSESHVTFRGSH